MIMEFWKSHRKVWILSSVLISVVFQCSKLDKANIQPHHKQMKKQRRVAGQQSEGSRSVTANTQGQQKAANNIYTRTDPHIHVMLFCYVA